MKKGNQRIWSTSLNPRTEGGIGYPPRLDFFFHRLRKNRGMKFGMTIYRQYYPSSLMTEIAEDSR